MATQSIFHNIIIQDPKNAEAFISALENAAAIAEKITPKKYPQEIYQKKKSKIFFDSEQMINYMQTNILDILEYAGEGVAKSPN